MRIGIDLGGTKIAGVALDRAGRELARGRRETPREGYEAICAAVVELVLALEADVGETGTVGLGTPGALSPATGRIKNSNTVALIGQPLREDLEAMLGRRVRLANDANCFALSEAVDGAGAGSEVVFGVILGTGTGGGVVVRGAPLTGPNAIAGEWGHNPLPWPRPEEGELPGPPCYCGKRGCLETWISGPGLARDHREHTGQALRGEAIVAAAASGDPASEATLARYVDRLGRGLAHVINLVDPDVIVLGGGLSRIARLYEAVPGRWGHYVFSDRVDTRLAPPRHGDDSGVRGAAWLWPQ